MDPARVPEGPRGQDREESAPPRRRCQTSLQPPGWPRPLVPYGWAASTATSPGPSRSSSILRATSGAWSSQAEEVSPAKGLVPRADRLAYVGTGGDYAVLPRLRWLPCMKRIGCGSLGGTSGRLRDDAIGVSGLVDLSLIHIS